MFQETADVSVPGTASTASHPDRDKDIDANAKRDEAVKTDVKFEENVNSDVKLEAKVEENLDLFKSVFADTDEDSDGESSEVVTNDEPLQPEVFRVTDYIH